MMKQRYLIFLLIPLTLFIACGEVRPTPTPFAEEDATEQANDLIEPLAISITDLAEDPESYADTIVEITGQYRQRALLVCDSDPHPAPATWQLEAKDGSLVAVGGFDSQVRSLLPNNLTMTVVGVWQLFEGPVGCGKSATNTQIWYLKARDILSPSPIARVTLTPTGSGSEIADTGEEGTAVSIPEDNNFTVTPTRTEDGGQPGGTPTLASTTVPAPPGSTPTTNNNATPTDEREDDEATLTPTRGEDNTIATPTPTNSGAATATPGSSSGTPTPSSSGGTPDPTSAVLTTATRDPDEFDTVEFEELGWGEPILELLEAEQAHLYPILFGLNSTGAVTITTIAEPNMNLVLEVVDSTNNLVQQANNTGNGGLESIVNAQLNVALNYKIRIYNLNANDGNYCLIFSEGGDLPDVIEGRVAYGQTVTGQVAGLGIDYWCFLGATGDNITITSTATGSSGDFVVGLFGPPTYGPIGDAYDDPQIMNISLEADGMFLIGVLDFEAAESGYSLTLTKN